MLGTAIARMRAAMQKGGIAGEQEQQRRNQVADDRAFRDRAYSDGLEAQRKELELRMQAIADDKAWRELQLTEGRTRWEAEQKARREAAVRDAIAEGYTDAPEQTMSAVSNAVSMMGGGPGASQSLPRVGRTQRYAGKVGDVSFEAPDMGGPQYAMVGGRPMRVDRQQSANAAMQGEARKAQLDDAKSQRDFDEARKLAQMQINAANLRSGIQGGRLTEAESKDYLFAGTATDASKTLDQYGDKIDANKVAAYFTSRLFKPTLTADEQVYVRAARDFASAVLRKESGAAITDDEVRDVMSRYIASALDSPELGAAKQEARAAYVERMNNLAGRGRTLYGDSPVSPPPAPGAVRPKRPSLDSFPGHSR